MWITSDERRLLACYYRQGKVDEWQLYHTVDLGLLFDRGKRGTKIPQYGEERPKRFEGQHHSVWLKKFFDSQTRVEIANLHLAKRGLVSVAKHEGENGVEMVRLTLAGYDLGRQYDHWFFRSGLWWREYRDHWLVAFVTFVLGAMVGTYLAKE